MSKTFAQAPKPKYLSDAAIVAFEKGGSGQDTATRKPTNPQMRESSRRLSIDMPESLHRRFKTACSGADKKMNDEVIALILKRTEQLEQSKN